MSDRSQIYRPEEIRYNDGIETNLWGIAKQICDQRPQPPCSIGLMMDHEVDDPDPDAFEFNLIKNITLVFIQILFGDQVNPMTLSSDNFELLNAYLHSIGHHLSVREESTETTQKLTMKFMSYQDYQRSIKGSPLEHLRSHMN